MSFSAQVEERNTGTRNRNNQQSQDPARVNTDHLPDLDVLLGNSEFSSNQLETQTQQANSSTDQQTSAQIRLPKWKLLPEN
ncbi:hypothetical protein [Persicobacter sp. CCB-QB2]|uniref:hypothetical protein n=1 Tax=Persicobacter sp. CCB-QB2 TaxID=1561025 RepID=UPI0006A973C6|nr:hypothetical protein [Persicobacter sp. CCB-QB2]